MTTGSPNIFRNFKYVDILSFSRLLFGGFSPFMGIALIIVAFLSLFFLVRLWWKLKNINDCRRDLILACTLTWTAVFNFHFAIYDTILVVASSLLTANVFSQYSPASSATLTPAFRFLLVLLYLTPWISQYLAKLIGFQIFTVVLAATGIYQLLTERHLRLNAKLHNLSG